MSSLPDFVYYIPKLLIPTVSNYQEDPAAYIDTRILALYTYIHWKMNWNHYNNNQKIQWADLSLTRDWGAANKVSGQDYVQRVTVLTGAAERPDFPLALKEFIWDSVRLPLMRRGTFNVFPY